MLQLQRARLVRPGVVTNTAGAGPQGSTPAFAHVARAVREDITPLARNEWICWVISGKKAETRNIRIKKGLSKLRGGMRRPCCWAGWIHR